ncbi:MAG: tetratricopeptide repeat-containing serine/threonine-protein kinase, partial [bacterium]
MIGRTVSHYRILEKLGEGGMGVVYKAEDLNLRRIVALKFLPPQLTREDNARKRFIHEAQAASALQHNNICAIHEIENTPDGQMFICMDHYTGESLDSRTARGPMPLFEAVDVAKQAAQGLAKAHEAGIVHRDIKPANIVVTQDGVVKILDFGIAKLGDRTRVTHTGATLGTISYMSPEQAKGDDVDARTDVWALGVTLYEMLTGQVPFRAAHDTAVIYSILNEPHEPVAAIRPEVPETLTKIVDRALAKDPGNRYQNAGEMARDLEGVAEALSERARQVRSTGGTERSAGARRAKIWVPVAVALAAVAFFVVKPLFFSAPAISAPRPVAVITFQNQTGNDEYDYLRTVIPNLLITKLEQSKYLSVVSWERLHDLLEQMGRGDVTLIDKETGFEACRLDGIETIVLGSYTKAGDVFVTDVKVLDVASKSLLKSASAKGEGVESILESQIDQLGSKISEGIGLSERSVVAVPPVAKMTTHSMDAYHFYLKGRDEYYDRAPVDALGSLRRAVDLDSTFAAAWLYLGRTYRNLREYIAANAAYEKAKALAPMAPEKDRLYIEAAFERDEDRRFELLRELVERYPKEKLAHYEVGAYYQSRHMTRQAIASFQEALALDPDYGEALNQLAYVYADLGDYQTALRYLERYAAVSPGEPNPMDSMA